MGTAVTGDILMVELRRPKYLEGNHPQSYFEVHEENY